MNPNTGFKSRQMNALSIKANVSDKNTKLIQKVFSGSIEEPDLRNYEHFVYLFYMK
jgi:hypothetical protein